MEEVSYPLSALRGLVTEGSSLLLLRLMALRKTVRPQMNFVSFDQELRVIRSTVVRHDAGLILYAFFRAVWYYQNSLLLYFCSAPVGSEAAGGLGRQGGGVWVGEDC